MVVVSIASIVYGARNQRLSLFTKYVSRSCDNIPGDQLALTWGLLLVEYQYLVVDTTPRHRIVSTIVSLPFLSSSGSHVMTFKRESDQPTRYFHRMTCQIGIYAPPEG